MKLKEFFIVTVFGFITAWFGALAIPVVLLVSCNLIDYFTGMMAAHARGEKVTSAKGVMGIYKKASQWILVLIGFMVDSALTSGTSYIGWNVPVYDTISIIVALWLVFNEMLSILENVSDMGTSVPPFLVSIVTKLRTYTQNTGNKLPTEKGDKT